MTIEYIPSVLMLQPGLPATGTFQASFTRLLTTPPTEKKSILPTSSDDPSTYNPHQEIASFLAPRLIEGDNKQTRQALQEFVVVSRDVDV